MHLALDRFQDLSWLMASHVNAMAQFRPVPDVVRWSISAPAWLFRWSLAPADATGPPLAELANEVPSAQPMEGRRRGAGRDAAGIRRRAVAGDHLDLLPDRTAALLAKAIGISPSYLNQIETDQRPLTPGILQRMCGPFAVGIDCFGEDEELRAAQDRHEALTDSLFGGKVTAVWKIQSAVQVTPGVARRFLLLHRAYVTQAEHTGTEEKGVVPYRIKPPQT